MVPYISPRGPLPPYALLDERAKESVWCRVTAPMWLLVLQVARSSNMDVATIPHSWAPLDCCKSVVLCQRMTAGAAQREAETYATSQRNIQLWTIHIESKRFVCTGLHWVINAFCNALESGPIFCLLRCNGKLSKAPRRAPPLLIRLHASSSEWSTKLSTEPLVSPPLFTRYPRKKVFFFS